MNAFLSALNERRGGKTLKDWSEDLNISESALSRILNGQSGMRSDVLRRILRAYPDLFPIWLNDDHADSSSVGVAA